MVTKFATFLWLQTGQKLVSNAASDPGLLSLTTNLRDMDSLALDVSLSQAGDWDFVYVGDPSLTFLAMTKMAGRYQLRVVAQNVLVLLKFGYASQESQLGLHKS